MMSTLKRLSITPKEEYNATQARSKVWILVPLETEAEYVALITAGREGTIIINVLKEIDSKGMTNTTIIRHIYCKIFEDISGALESARVSKMRHGTKYTYL
eukprot:12656581-Ditylum_brightwellii.AAC.1